MQLSTTHARSARTGRVSLAAAVAATLLASPFATSFAADVSLPPISVGGGVRTSFSSLDVDNAAEDVNDFALESVRLYISGKATDSIGFIFNTEYNSATEAVSVMDAIATFTLSDQFNIWAGRLLPPSDRANLYGPYYASHWGVYSDGVQDGYPTEAVGRDDGVTYWGQFGIAKVSLGAFDITGLTTNDADVLYAGRVQLDFWDKEDGYFLNGTYYGAKDLLAVGVAGQTAGSDIAYSVDFLLEKKLGGGGVVTVEAEYANYDGLGGYSSPVSIDVLPGPGVNAQPLAYESQDGYYVLGAYLFGPQMGIGRFQILAKYGEATYDYAGAVPDADQTTAEVDLNYIIKDFNARVSLYWVGTEYDHPAPLTRPDRNLIGLGVQVQI